MTHWVKRGIALAAGSGALSGLVSILEQFGDRRSNLLRVLTYHRVDTAERQPELDPALISATPEQFASQMEFLARNYCVVTIDEVLAAFDKGRPLPPRSVLLTFDDAYCDFELFAWPVLKQHRLPVTMFVATAYPDQPRQRFWWDRIFQSVNTTHNGSHLDTPLGRLSLETAEQKRTTHRCLVDYVKGLDTAESLRAIESICASDEQPATTNGVLGWDALRRLSGEGVTLAPHTQTHPLLNRATLEEARQEAVGSRLDLEREIGSALPILAYPAGGYSRQVADMLEQEGFRLAFTTRRGVNRVGRADPFCLRRINVGHGTNNAIMRAQLLPIMGRCNRLLGAY